jgi:hypothetical protein
MDRNSPIIVCQRLAEMRLRVGGTSAKAMGRQFDVKVHRVNDPAQNNFSCGPCRLSLAKFFDRDRFLVKAEISGIQGAKNLVHGMNQNLADCAEASRSALGKGDKMIDVNVMGGQGL